ncbi:MAG: SulP family inorganic anion transporter [Pirellulales bacterium]|nr:SulP family inorganic anion transporter [Pirellulales bacterium]
MDQPVKSQARKDAPAPGFAGMLQNWQPDLTSGFLVFLIALPLCLGISLASGFPAIAGVFTAIIGGIVASLISNSELTIKGPAAGLIVIVLGAMNDFGYTRGADAAADAHAYHMTLAVGLVAACIQIGFAVLRAGVLSELFPLAAVHGMLAAIGVIIISKQAHVMLGVKPTASEPLPLLAEIPHSLMNLNPEVAIIGLISLVVLFGVPLIKNKTIRKVPSQLIVILLAIPLGMYFDLAHEHSYKFASAEFKLGPKFLVDVPSNMFAAMTHPEFGVLTNPVAWKWIAMFALIGSLESLLSAKAIDLLDPWRRKTNFNRDLLAVGVGNAIAASIGGLPMISEIVRSRANIDNGARTRGANLFHSLFLLAFVALVPNIIHQIPLTALAAMLCYTGFRLAHPREFWHVWQIGAGQLLVFVTTLVAVLATDLLIGVLIGIALQIVLLLFDGAPLVSLVKPHLEIDQPDEKTFVINVRHSAAFTTWLGLRKQIYGAGADKDVVIDLSDTRLVDHNVLEKLHELEREFETRNCRLVIKGLDEHQSSSSHPTASRRKPKKVETAVPR